MRNRRELLRALGGTTFGLALAGCTDGGGSAETSSPAATGSPTPTPESTAAGGELDLAEANVVGVTIEERDGGFRFDVTLHHDDGGEPGYANRWQVERLDGTPLGRRELTHPHSQQPFTRAATIDVPQVTCVVVRGHDETHGFGGQAMLVDLASGATRAVRQGPERASFGAADCP